jgi:NAD(P)-dependent dehydrogenase (short-subunit alcohol dehydrogenase family)
MHAQIYLAPAGSMDVSQRRLAGAVAVVTGASSGIGRAIAIALAREGAQLYAAGRNGRALMGMISIAREFSSAVSVPVDLAAGEGVAVLAEHVEQAGRLDILIHSAGILHSGRMAEAPVGDFDSHYAVNVRAPYVLTQRLLPMLVAARGQIVFINSSAGLTAKQADLGQYSAMKHALKAIADSLREEVNPKGVRVLSVFPGRTATRMQEARFREEGKVYRPELLLQPEDVAALVVSALLLPSTAEVTDISMRPMCRV